MCWMCEMYEYDDLWYFNPNLLARHMYTRKDRGKAQQGHQGQPLPDPDGAKFGESPSGPPVPTQQQMRDILADEPEKHPEALRIFNENLRKGNDAIGQVITLQEAHKIADIGAPMGSMGCMCRWLHRAYDERNPNEFSCLGTGVGMFKSERWPERYKGGVQLMPPEEVKEWLTKWNKRGFMHLIMALPGGYIEGVCNCEYPACLTIRNRLDMGIETLLKGHYVASVDYDKCNGCGDCVERCQYGAVKFEVRIDKTNIDQLRCFGCGLCQVSCPREAITMVDRESLPGMKEVW